MFGVGAGAVSIAVDGIAALITIHFLLKFVSAAEAGYWLLMTTLGGLLLLGQGAIGPSVARHVAQRLDSGNGETTSVARMARLMAASVLVVAALCYVLYLRHVKVDISTTATWLGWVLYATGLAGSLVAASKFAVLNGYGEVGWDKVTRIALSLGGLAANWLVLRFGGGVIGLGAVFFIQGATSIGFAEYLLRRHRPARLVEATPQPGELRPLMLETGKLLSLSLIGYVVMNSGTFIIERRFGTEMVSRYAPLVRVGALLSNVAVLIPQTVYPFVARAWAKGDFKVHNRFFTVGWMLAIGLYVLGALVCLLAAPKLMPLWLGSDRYLGGAVFALVLGVYALIVANISFSNPVLASVGNAFVAPSIVNLLLVVPLLWYWTQAFGIVGAPLAMLAGSFLPSAWVIFRSCKIMSARNQ
jgi:O-antigen/teichoic acid export membrane protein